MDSEFSQPQDNVTLKEWIHVHGYNDSLSQEPGDRGRRRYIMRKMIVLQYYISKLS